MEAMYVPSIGRHFQIDSSSHSSVLLMFSGTRKRQPWRRILRGLQGHQFLLGVVVVDDIKPSIFVCGDGPLDLLIGVRCVRRLSPRR